MKKQLLILASILGLFGACKKDEPETPAPSPSLASEIIHEFSNNVIVATYNDLDAKAEILNQNILTLQVTTNETNLTACKQAWRDCRSAWEQSESFLFGPVATENIDPRIDTWPVNFADLDSVLASSSVFTTGYIDNLDDALKGFHPIEYLLFGTSGNKTATAFTARELDYLGALSLNLKSLVSQLPPFWNSSIQGSFYNEFNTAGSGSTIYASQRSAYEEMVNAMIGICDEVANGKISEPFIAQDPSLEESPFAFNSITDFTNNIKGVKNVYRGIYIADGKGIEDLVRSYNLSLDGNIKQKADAAIAALGTITVPFGQAITQQPVQVQNSINAINDLKTVLENDLLPFVQLHTN
ncbi:MAG: imelysin family protein [Bacteroidia bacterium]